MTVPQQKLHVLFLTPTLDVEAPRTIRVRQLVEHLKNRFDITILCFTPSPEPPVEIEGVRIVRLPMSWLTQYITNKTDSGYQPAGLAKFVSRSASLLLNSLWLFPDPWIFESKRLLRALSQLPSPPDIIVATAIPFSMAHIANRYKQQCGLANRKIRTILDIGDPFTHNVVGHGRSRLRRKQAFEQAYLDAADHVVVTNTATGEHYQRGFGVDAGRITVISQGARPPLQENINNQHDGAEQRVRSKGNIALVYAGVFIHRLRDPDALMAALERAANIELNVYGPIEPRYPRNFRHVTFHGKVPYMTLQSRLNTADCLLFIDNAKGMQSSGKIYELLAMKKPILFLYTNPDSALVQACREFEHIMMIENSAVSIKSALDALPAFLEKPKSVDYDVDDHLWSSKARQFGNIFHQVMAS